MNSNLYLGIDVSKGYADFALLDCKKKVVGKPFQLYDVSKGHQALDEYLGTLVEQHHPELIYAAVESTGTYENHWLDTLTKLRTKYPLKAARLNPLGVLKHRQAGLQEQVTDRQSSIAIASYLINHTDSITFNRIDSFANYRMYLGHISLLTKQLVQLKNDLRQFLYLYFPEVLPYCRQNLSESILELLEQYPTAQDMSKSRQGKRNKIPYFTATDWQVLREKCKSGVGSSSDAMAERIILDLVSEIGSLSHRIEEYYDMLYDLLPKDQLQILISMPGIAKRTAVILLCIIGDISRFESSHQLIGYFGLYPVTKESGDGKKKPHMSKKGSVLMRKHLYLSAMVACNCDPYLRNLYLKSVEKGMAKKSAICKIMSKMLRMLYGMLTHYKPYDTNIDNDYRGRCPKQKELHNTPICSDSLDETNAMIAEAPISKKHAHNRKEQTNAVTRTRSSNRSLTAPSNLSSKTK